MAATLLPESDSHSIRERQWREGPAWPSAVSDDGAFVMEMCLDGSAKLWSVQLGRYVETFEPGAEADAVYSTAVAPGGGFVEVQVSKNGSAELPGLASSGSARSWQGSLGLKPGSGSARTLLDAPTGSDIDTSLGGWTPETDDGYRNVTSITSTPEVCSRQLRASAGPADVLVVTSAASAQLCRPAHGRSVQSTQVAQSFALGPPVASQLHSAARSADGTLLLTLGLDGGAQLWSVASGRCLETFSPSTATDAAAGAAASDDGHRVVTASRGGAAKIWNVNTGQCMQSFERIETRTGSAASFEPSRIPTPHRIRNGAAASGMVYAAPSSSSTVHVPQSSAGRVGDVRQSSPAGLSRSLKRLGPAIIRCERARGSVDPLGGTCPSLHCASPVSSDSRQPLRARTPPPIPQPLRARTPLPLGSTVQSDRGVRPSLHCANPVSSNSRCALRARTPPPMGSGVLSAPLSASGASSAPFELASSFDRSWQPRPNEPKMKRPGSSDRSWQLLPVKDSSPQARLREIVAARSPSTGRSRERARSLDALAGGRMVSGSWATRPVSRSRPSSPGSHSRPPSPGLCSTSDAESRQPIARVSTPSRLRVPRGRSGSPDPRSASRGKTTPPIYPCGSGMQRRRAATPPAMACLRPSDILQREAA